MQGRPGGCVTLIQNKRRSVPLELCFTQARFSKLYDQIEEEVSLRVLKGNSRHGFCVCTSGFGVYLAQYVECNFCTRSYFGSF